MRNIFNWISPSPSRRMYVPSRARRKKSLEASPKRYSLTPSRFRRISQLFSCSPQDCCTIKFLPPPVHSLTIRLRFSSTPFYLTACVIFRFVRMIRSPQIAFEPLLDLTLEKRSIKEIATISWTASPVSIMQLEKEKEKLKKRKIIASWSVCLL